MCVFSLLLYSFTFLFSPFSHFIASRVFMRCINSDRSTIWNLSIICTISGICAWGIKLRWCRIWVLERRNSSTSCRTNCQQFHLTMNIHNFIFNCAHLPYIFALWDSKTFCCVFFFIPTKHKGIFARERASALAVRVISEIISEVCIDTWVKINCTNKLRLRRRLRRGFTFTSFCSSLAQSNSYLITLGSATAFNVASPNGSCKRQSVNGARLTVIG